MDERRLRKFFHFTEADLLANKRGEFSDGQKKLLSQHAREEQASARSSALILFVVAAAGLAVGLTIASIAPTVVGRILIFLLMGVLWTSAWGWKGVTILLEARKLQEPHLCQVIGLAHILHPGEEEYMLQVGELQFDLDGNPSGAIIEGAEYSVHYLEATEEILSVDVK